MMFRIVLTLFAALLIPRAATVKDLSEALFSSLSKVYSAAPFRTRLEVKALDMELRVMRDAANVDRRGIGAKYDSSGLIPMRNLTAYYDEIGAFEKTPLPPLKTKTPIEIHLTVPHIDSLHFTLDEDRASTPFIKIVADTSK